MSQDFIFDENNKLLISGGDLVVGESKNQHIKDLFNAEKGFYKFSPKTGIGASTLINDELNVEDLLRIIRLELERDGLKITKLYMTNEGNIEVDGNYIT